MYTIYITFVLYQSKIWILKQKDNKIYINQDKIFQKNSRVHTFWPQNKWRNFGRAEIITSWWETKKIQIKLATTCNKNEQDVKNNVEL